MTMYSSCDTPKGGFPHSEISGSKLICQLPEAYRRLQRPSSPVIAKASTTCTYSLDPIGLRTRRHENQVKDQACVIRRLLVLLENLLRHLFDAITFIVPAKEQHVDYYQIVKEQPIVRILEPEAAKRTERMSSSFRYRIQSRAYQPDFNTCPEEASGGGERDRTDDPLLA